MLEVWLCFLVWPSPYFFLARIPISLLGSKIDIEDDVEGLVLATRMRLVEV